MQKLRTYDNAVIWVENATDAATRAALKGALAMIFSEYGYTGNSAAGTNSNYEDLAPWLHASGLQLIEDTDTEEEPDLPFLLLNLEKTTGIATLSHRGKTLRYHAQQRRGHDFTGMGYLYHIEYRLIDCT